MTGGGIIKDGKKPAFTFAGTVGNLEDGSVGQFQIVDHANKEAWHCNNDFSFLKFTDSSTTSPPATHNTATFEATFTSNHGGSEILRITIKDVAEPGKGQDTIVVEQWNDSNPGFFESWFSGEPIDGGNFQVHDLPAD